MEESPELRPQSEWNMAFSYLNRLNYLFYICNASAMSLDAHGWFQALLALNRELSSEMKEEEKQSWTKKKGEINDLISKRNQYYLKTGKTEIPSHLYALLDEFEVFLRTVLDRAGLQSKRKDDPSKAFL